MNRIRGVAVALILLTGCAGHKPTPFINRGKSSPITVADGSMEVRTTAHLTANGNTLTISGGQACSIRIGANGPYDVVSTPTDWVITSADGSASIQTANQDHGKTVIATGPNRGDLDDGPGSTYNAKFSPPTLTINGVAQTLNCPPNTLPRCKVRINYWVGGTCPH